MKKLILAVIVCPLLAAGGAFAEQVTTPAGALQIDMAAKWVWAYTLKDEDSQRPGRDEFTTSLVYLDLNGLISDDMSWRMEVAASYNPERNMGGLAGMGNPDDVGAIGIRQVYIDFGGMIPWTTVRIGTFIPPFTNYMPRPVTKLDLIQYPLLNAGAQMDPDLFPNDNRPFSRDLSTWQQTGVNFTVQLPYLLQIDLGMYNGAALGQANFNSDLAMAKNIVLTFRPDGRTTIGLAGWTEEFLADYPGIGTGLKRHATNWYLFGSYKAETVEVYADYAQGYIDKFYLDATGASVSDLFWESWQITACYWIFPELEAVVRYEYLDPNTVDGLHVPASRYDDSRWLTLGVNYFFLPQASVSANVVFKDEEGELIEEGKPGKDPLLPGYDPKYSAQRDTLLLVQVQVWQ